MFNKIYNFLSRQILTPTIKNKCRVFSAKDLRQYSNLTANNMSQLLGANWLFVNKFSAKSFKLLPRLTTIFSIILFVFVLIKLLFFFLI